MVVKPKSGSSVGNQEVRKEGNCEPGIVRLRQPLGRLATQLAIQDNFGGRQVQNSTSALPIKPEDV